MLRTCVSMARARTTASAKKKKKSLASTPGAYFSLLSKPSPPHQLSELTFGGPLPSVGGSLSFYRFTWTCHTSIDTIQCIHAGANRYSTGIRDGGYSSGVSQLFRRSSAQNCRRFCILRHYWLHLSHGCGMKGVTNHAIRSDHRKRWN